MKRTLEDPEADQNPRDIKRARVPDPVPVAPKRKRDTLPLDDHRPAKRPCARESDRNVDPSLVNVDLATLTDLGVRRLSCILGGPTHLRYHEAVSAFSARSHVPFYDWRYEVSTRLVHRDPTGTCHYETRVTTPSGEQKVLDITSSEHEASLTHTHRSREVAEFGDRWSSYMPILIPHDW